MKSGDKVKFYIDYDSYVGIIERIDDKTADVLVLEGLVAGVPITELSHP